MKQNRGEWSEFYCVLYLIVNNKLNIVDENLNIISNNIFTVKEIKTNIKYIIDNNILSIYFNHDKKIILINIDEIRLLKDIVFDAIIMEKSKNGSFEIPIITKFLEKFNIPFKIKSNSKFKEDIVLLNHDNNINMDVELGYSIKSQLGSPATLLNASKHTNFKYIVLGLTEKEIIEVNSINTRTKLQDRINKIIDLGGRIIFSKIESESFYKNLVMIDSNLPEALGEVLINSYIKNDKNLANLFKNSTVYKDKDIAIKKLKDLLNSISFSFMPSEEWNGDIKVKGGILIVSKDSNIYVLDNIYHKNIVNNYLIANTKLDSPSSSRYDMLKLEKIDNVVSFTLNLQVRYKK